jgi:hypothetical protein
MPEAALFARGQGSSLSAVPGPQGQSVGRTLEWLAPYARGELTHEEFVHSRVRFDAERAAAGVPGFSGAFIPKSAQWIYWLAAQLDARWLPLSSELGRPRITRRAPWLLPQRDGPLRVAGQPSPLPRPDARSRVSPPSGGTACTHRAHGKPVVRLLCSVDGVVLRWCR